VQVLSILLLHVQRVAVAEGVHLGAAHNTRSGINDLFLIVRVGHDGSEASTHSRPSRRWAGVGAQGAEVERRIRRSKNE
jgi:hypothetical protein